MTLPVTRRSIVAMLLAYVIPGAGHFFLGRYRRAGADLPCECRQQRKR